MITIFFSYAHEDSKYRDELEKHLSSLRREGLIDAWHDRRIHAGDELHEAIANKLEEATIILLLVSPDFLASDYCFDREMKRALERHATGSAVVIPVILRPCDWEHTSFSRLQASPQDGKPISKFANLDDAYLAVTKDIRAAISKVSPMQKSGRTVVERSAEDRMETAARPRTSNLRVKRQFSDREKDDFLEGTFEYVSNFFEESLAELARRNPGLETRIRRVSQERMVCAIYRGGTKCASCQIYIHRSFGRPGIAFLESDSERGEAFNDMLNVVDDGYALMFDALMPRMDAGAPKKGMSQEGVAELLWSHLVEHLQ